MPLDFDDLQKRIKANETNIYAQAVYDQFLSDLNTSWQNKQIDINQLQQLMRDLLAVCLSLNKSTNQNLISDDFKHAFRIVVMNAKRTLFNDAITAGPEAANLDSKLANSTNTVDFDLIQGKPEDEKAEIIIGLMRKIITSRNAYKPADPGLNRKKQKDKRKGQLGLLKLTPPLQTRTEVADTRYARLAGKESPQAKRLANPNRVFEKKTNFDSFYEAVSGKYNKLGNDQIKQGGRTSRQVPQEQQYIKEDKERAYVKTGLTASIVNKGKHNAMVVVEVQGATGKEEIIRIQKDRLICRSDLIPILDPLERGKLTGVGAEAVNAAAPAIADGFREMIQNAGNEYDVRYAIVNLLDDDDNVVPARKNDTDDAKLLIDLARNAFTAGAVPILDEDALECIRTLANSANADPYRAYAQHILAIDDLVFRKTGSPTRLKYDKADDVAVKKGIDEYKRLFDVNAARKIVVTNITPPSVKTAPITLEDTSGTELIPTENDVAAGAELIRLAKEALTQGSMPVFTKAQLDCVVNLQAKGTAAEKMRAQKIIDVVKLVYGDHTGDPEDVSLEQVAAGLRAAKKDFPTALQGRFEGPTPPPLIPTTSKLSAKEENVINTFITKTKEPEAIQTPGDVEHKIDKQKYKKMLRVGLTNPVVNELTNFGLFHKGNLAELKEIFGAEADERLGADGANLPDEGAKPTHKKFKA